MSILQFPSKSGLVVASKSFMSVSTLKVSLIKKRILMVNLSDAINTYFCYVTNTIKTTSKLAALA